MKPAADNQRLAEFFQELPFQGTPLEGHLTGLTFYSPRIDKGGMTLMGVWTYLNEIKVSAVKVLPQERWLEVKQECDDLFRQASGGRFNICPAIFIGGFGMFEKEFFRSDEVKKKFLTN